MLTSTINEETCKRWYWLGYEVAKLEANDMSKYGNQWSWSELCQRNFHSRLERDRAEQLRLMELAGEIKDLKFQVPVTLCNIKGHFVQLIVDFSYIYHREWEDELIYEDAKGYLTKDARVKIAWAKDKLGIDVILYKGE